jgi:hypothetical protein
MAHAELSIGLETRSPPKVAAWSISAAAIVSGRGGTGAGFAGR